MFSCTVDLKAKTLTITLPIQEKTSSSGKSTIVATTGGFQTTDAKHNGKAVRVSVNAIVEK